MKRHQKCPAAAPALGSGFPSSPRKAEPPADEVNNPRSFRRWIWLWGFILLAATLLAYQPAWTGAPIWDDDAHLTRPELRSLAGLLRIWTEPGVTQQYYPLTHSMFWMGHKLWGEATPGYHLVNILLHALSALLVWQVLRRWQVPGAWLAAAIFALHPVEVESVAWISELKNTLSGFLYLGAVLAYLRFDRTRGAAAYVLALGLFLLGLGSKTVVATFPAAMLLVFWWQRGRFGWRRDVCPLLPFCLAGLMAGLFTTWVEARFVGATGAEYDLSWLDRVLIAGRAFWFYQGKLFWPVELTFIYPRWQVNLAAWWQYLFPVTALMVLLMAWLGRRRNRGLLAGLLFFTVTLLPALGFVNVYPFRYSFVADHFQYLASLGIIVLVSTGIARLLTRLRLWGRVGGHALCLVLLFALGILTWRQCGMYANVESLWRTTLARNSNCWMAHSNWGTALAAQGRWAEAIEQFERVLQLNPDDAVAHSNLGIALGAQGKLSEAIPHHERALQLNPDDAVAHNNLGIALAASGRPDEAILHYEQALQFKPGFVEARYNLGDALATTGRLNEAIPHFQQALNLATAQTKTVLAETIRARLKSYEPALPPRQTP